ncbi:ABC-type polysaccharide/polyol phosphate export permease [Lachnospiraceae bacterium XBB2008]|nr:ABC-type polysaccharide/polyol phosphate export permease [Lachnospiraceae bacterium XBB2008]
MNNTKHLRIIYILKRVFLVLFFLGVATCGLYPVANQPIKVIVDSSTDKYVFSLSPAEVDKLSSYTMDCPGISEATIDEIRISRHFESICVDKITTGAFPSYGIIEGDSVVLNSEACDLLREASHSAVLERILFSEGLLVLTLLIWILLNALGEKIDPDNRNNHGPIYEIRKFCSEIKEYRQYMVFAANADLKAEVANSYLNRLWWLLEPLFNMLVYVVVFGKIMGNSIQNYATFVYSSLLMWTFFSKVLNYSVKCVRNNRDIVTKIYVPKHVLLITNMILDFFKLLFSLIVLIPMLIIFKVHIGIAAFWIIPTYLLMIIFSFGVGMIFLHYGVYIDDLSYAVGILLQMMMFLSGIFYDVITSLPHPLNVVMICVNPASMFVDTMRRALLYNTVSNVPLIVLWIIISLLISYIGIHIVYKNENGYVKVI